MRRRSHGPSGRRRGLVPASVLLAALACAQPASARALLVATDTPELWLVELSTNAVVAQLPMPGPVRSVAVRPFGGRGYAAAGNSIVEIDIDGRAETRRATLPGAPISQLVTARDGRLMALQGSRVTLVSPASLAPTGTIALGRGGRQLVAGRRASEAAVVLTGGRVGILGLEARRLLRTVRVPGARGVALDGGGRAWVTAGRSLRMIPARRRKVSKTMKLTLPRGAGGSIALSPRDGRLAIGALPGASTGAIVNPAAGRVKRFAAGSGAGAPWWSLDASRVYHAEGGSRTVSVIGAGSRRRLGVIALPATRPLEAVEQPGLALLPGTDGPDVLTGTSGRDRIMGAAGDDHLRGARGRDIVDGGPGDDRVSGGAQSDVLHGGDGSDLLAGGAGDDALDGGAGDDNADGGTGNDTIEGGDGDDLLDGGDGDDAIFAGEGDDRIIEKGFGNDKRLNGGPGNDHIEGGRGSDRLIEGEAGDDKLYGGPGNEKMYGGAGHDLVDGGRGADRLYGDAGDDELRGDAAGDVLEGADGNDSLDGGSGADRLHGGPGDDAITGGPGADLIFGGDGEDTIRVADDSADTVDCGAGHDTVYVEGGFPQRDRLIDCETVIPIPPEEANDTNPPSLFFGTAQPEFIRGTPGDDSIIGNGGNDRLFGGDGDDYVDGGDGDDRLHGGAGSDILAGRNGNDRIYGGAGDDRITGDRGRDTIFGASGNDTIFGNLDNDTIDGGPGNDRINVVGGGRDVVRCGGGNDRVFADVHDRVTADCERISR